MKNLDAQIEACRISARARDYGLSLIREGVRLYDVAEAVEKKIRDMGGEPAFPVNLSLNRQAAHYTPFPGDSLVFVRGDVVKIDVGAHVDGYIGDTAATVEVGSGRWISLIKSAERALEAAIEVVRPGVSVGDIGRVIEKTVVSLGFQPVRNLSGHGLRRYELHADPSIPNFFDTTATDVLAEGDVVAIEPFATNGVGLIENSRGGNIFHLLRERTPRNRSDLAVYEVIVEKHRYFPFASRWLVDETGLSWAEVEKSLRRLVRLGVVMEYPILVEKSGGIVSQKEHTMLVTEDGVEVLTR